MHSDTANDHTHAEQPLCSPVGHSMVTDGEAWRGVAKKSGCSPMFSSESKSLGLTPTIAHRPHRRIAVRSRAATVRAQAQSQPIGGGR